jgi:ABC-type transport system substrate-binding protein
MMWETFQSSTGPIKPIYEFLVYQDRFSGEYTNDQLATDWTMSADGKAWTFQLREGVPFHSTDSYQGTEFTAKDVIATARSQAREDSLSNPSLWNGLGVKDANFEIRSDHEIVWKMDRAEALMDFWLSEEWTGGVISQDYLDAVSMEGYQKQPIGTGPFKFVELKINEYILHERVENHWRQTPEFHELQFVYSNEDATRLAMLLAKEVHIADIPKNLLPEATAKGFEIATSTLPGFYAYAFIGGQYYDKPMEIRAGAKKGEMEPLAPGYNPDDPFRKLEVRKALNLAINRQQIRDAFWGEAAMPQSIHNVPPYREDFSENWKPYPYDPEEAKRLLAEAGYPNGFEFDFLTAKAGGAPELPEVAEAMAAMWQDIGLRPNLQELELGAMLQKQRERDMGGTMSLLYYATGPAPIGWCFPMSNVAGGCGSAIWEYPELDDMFIKLKETVDRDEMLRQIQTTGDWMYEHYLIVPLYFLFPQVAYDPSVLQGYEANHLHFGPTRHHEYTKAVFQ